MSAMEGAPVAVAESEIFSESLYRAWNPDVDAAIRAGAMESARLHFERFGRGERRPPYAGSHRGTPMLRVGDKFLQPVRPRADWWAGAATTIAIQGGLVRLGLDCAVLCAEAKGTVRAFRYDEWVAHGEQLVLKFPPIEQSRGVGHVLRIVVRSIEGAAIVQLPCEPAGDDDGLGWNDATPARVRAEFALLHTPLTPVGPAGITLNPLTHCEGGCIHCLGRMHQRKPGSLRNEWIDALRAHFRDGPGAAWCTDYATDFFKVARGRPELLDLLAAKGSISINTEGQHVTADALRRLMAGGLIKIGFSCDAATEATYALVRPGLGKLETVLASARLAVRLRREFGDGTRPTVALLMVAMKCNVHELVPLVELAAQNGVDAVWINHLWVCSADMMEQSLMLAPKLWREHLARAHQRGHELGVGIFTGVDIRPERPQVGVTWCPEPWSAMIILGNGDVLACASPASRIGSLSGSTIAEIWNSEAFQELRRRANSERPPLMCYHCFAYRKPGNADGVFMHHLVDGYDLRRDLADDGYAEAFRRRFSFAEFNRSRRVNAGAR